MDLVKHRWVNQKLPILGTTRPTNKKYFQNDDMPFITLSKGALCEGNCGWFCEAVIETNIPTDKNIYSMHNMA